MTHNEWIDAINEIPIEDLCARFDIAVRKGSVLCPSHNDRHFGNCRISERGFYCFACGAKGSKIQLIQAYTKTSFLDCCSMISDAFQIERPDKRRTKREERMPLTKEQVAYLGLAEAKTVILPQKFSDIKPKEGRFMEEYHRDGKWFYITGEEERFSLNTLFREDKELFHTIVRGKLIEKLPLYAELYRQEVWKVYADGDTALARSLQEVLEEAIDALKPLLQTYPIRNLKLPEKKKKQRKREMKL